VNRKLKIEFGRQVTTFFTILFAWLYLEFLRSLLVGFALLLLFFVQFVDQFILVSNLVVQVTNLVVLRCFVLLRLLLEENMLAVKTLSS
jgi:hypothetical protein